jgi:transcriptional antiterminator RfaH
MVKNQSNEDSQWYCVQTKPKCEHIASANLAHLEGVEVFCPRIRFQKKTARGKVWFVEALFPGYLFARFHIVGSLRAVNGAHAVLRVVRFGSGSYPSVPDEIIDEWQQAVDDRKVITVTEQFQPGDEVEVVEGPMRGIRTVITRIFPARDRVRILLDLLGEVREVTVALDILSKKENIRLATTDVSR